MRDLERGDVSGSTDSPATLRSASRKRITMSHVTKPLRVDSAAYHDSSRRPGPSGRLLGRLPPASPRRKAARIAAFEKVISAPRGGFASPRAKTISSPVEINEWPPPPAVAQTFDIAGNKGHRPPPSYCPNSRARCPLKPGPRARTVSAPPRQVAAWPNAINCARGPPQPARPHLDHRWPAGRPSRVSGVPRPCLRRDRRSAIRAQTHPAGRNQLLRYRVPTIKRLRPNTAAGVRIFFRRSKKNASAFLIARSPGPTVSGRHGTANYRRPLAIIENREITGEVRQKR